MNYSFGYYIKITNENADDIRYIETTIVNSYCDTVDIISGNYYEIYYAPDSRLRSYIARDECNTYGFSREIEDVNDFKNICIIWS